MRRRSPCRGAQQGMHALTALRCCWGCPQVVVYNYMKLQQMKAKAALSTTKDVEKLGAGGGFSRV